jgi:hypothetical protein
VRSSKPPRVIALEKLSHDRAAGKARLRGTLHDGAVPNRGLNVIDECIDDHVLEIDAPLYGLGTIGTYGTVLTPHEFGLTTSHSPALKVCSR